MSQYLDLIDQQIAVEPEERRRGELVARKAIYLARLGRFGDAKDAVQALRAHFGHDMGVRLTVLIMLAEGLVRHYESLAPSAMERIRGAQALAIAAKDGEMSALVHAWKGHLDFELSRFDASARSIETALGVASQDDHASMARCAVVIFNAFTLIGQRQPAASWFRIGRQHAVEVRDMATIEALLHSKVSFNVARLRAVQALSMHTDQDIQFVRAELKSATNLQALSGITALGDYIRLAEARLQVLEGKFLSASKQFALLTETALLPQHHFNRAMADLETAHCLLRAGEQDASAALFASIDRGALETLDIDDQLIAAFDAHELAQAFPQVADPVITGLALEDARTAYLDQSAMIERCFGRFAA